MGQEQGTEARAAVFATILVASLVAGCIAVPDPNAPIITKDPTTTTPPATDAGPASPANSTEPRDDHCAAADDHAANASRLQDAARACAANRTRDGSRG
ncbi:MAG: hypothetical protein ACYDCK_03705 [Thermoplasmatota archaeon]